MRRTLALILTATTLTACTPRPTPYTMPTMTTITLPDCADAKPGITCVTFDPDQGNMVTDQGKFSQPLTTTVPVHTEAGWQITMPVCVAEDSRNCVWLAATLGNGDGISYIDINGIGFPIPQ